MEWKTRITELLGCKYPILQGAFAGLGDWKFAAAVSNTGAHGNITAAVSRTPEKLREDIRSYRDATDDKPVSVNISVGNCPHEDEMLEAALDEGVQVIETAVYNADKHGKRIKEAGRKWIHKAATLKHALHAEEQGADAVIIVGLEGIGYKNINQLTTMTTLLWAKKFIKVPIVIAGGLGDERTFLGALAMGADGIMMGTRFMATKECPVADRHKEAMVKTPPDHPQLKYTCLAMPEPKAYEEVMELRDQIPLEEWLPKLERVMLKETGWKDAPLMYDMSHNHFEYMSGMHSMSVATIDSIPTCKELVDSIVHGAEEILDRLEFLKTR
jgi:nitronate monooxygenase